MTPKKAAKGTFTLGNARAREVMDYLKLYGLESFLFDDVTTSFRKNRKLSAFEFFCIIIWKANRAKSKVARKLRSHADGAGHNLDTIVGCLTSAIANAQTDEARMRILIEDWAFRLPMASAILTVLYPDSFTVYDARVCDQLRNHHSVQHKTRFDELWAGYQAYLADVHSKEPAVHALRDKDRTLWAKSFEKQLKEDISGWSRSDNDYHPLRLPPEQRHQSRLRPL